MCKIRAEIVAQMEDCFLELFALFRIYLTCPEFATAAQPESVKMIRIQTALDNARVRAGSSQWLISTCSGANLIDFAFVSFGFNTG
jgi:hypothetical protein